MQKVVPISILIVLISLIAGVIIQKNLFLSPAPTQGTVLAVQATPTPVPSFTPTPVPLPPTPSLSARAYLIVPENTTTPIIESHSQERLPPASTTKMMTALVALNSYDLQQIVTIANPYSVGATIDLVSGEQISVEKLLYGLLLPSGNDAAMALADTYPGGQDQFVKQMNLMATQFNLSNTHFINPTGLDDPDHYSTAQDLIAIAKIAMTHPIFRQIVDTKQATITSQDNSVTHVLENRNQLLGQLGVMGVKTGYTSTAGEVLVTSLQRRSGLYYLVVMGSADRFADTKLLINWLDDYLGTYRIAP